MSKNGETGFPMFIILSCAVFLLFCSHSHAQIKIDYGIITGPNLSVLLSYENGEPLRYYQPPGPLYRVTWHGGGFAEAKIHKYLSVRLAAMYQQKGSLNGDGVFEEDVLLEYISVPLTLLYQPVISHPFRIEMGMAYEYLFHQSPWHISGQDDDKDFSHIIGFEYAWHQRWLTGIKWYNTLSYRYSGQVAPNIYFQSKTQSFQLSVMYKIKAHEK